MTNSSPPGKRGLGGLCQRIHAHMMEQCKGTYEPLVRDRKRALLGDLRGTVLEIGPGAGPNLAYYPRGITWVGVEPNPHMHPYLRAEAARRGVAVELRAGSAEALPADDGGVDAVVSTLVLCSVADVARALAEARRVLRPGGRFVFLEHVAAPAGTPLRLVQNMLQPIWTPLADGCRPNRETWAAIEEAGFAHVELAHFRLPIAPMGPHIAGVAVR